MSGSNNQLLCAMLLAATAACPLVDNPNPLGASSNTETGETAATETDGNDQGDGDGDHGTDAEAGTNATGDGDGDSGDGDGGAGDGDGDGDGDAGLCENGMQDPGETGVDCGGICVWINPANENDIEGQCGEGDLCALDIDCIAGFCDMGMCNLCPGDPLEFDPVDLGYNECQSCLLSNCCEDVMNCFDTIEKCVCWFNCVSSTGDTQLCMDECGNGNIGTINSCMNSECTADGEGPNCDVP